MARPRKAGKRHPGGKLVQPGVMEGLERMAGPALRRRCRVMRWPEKHWLKARNPELATLHGRMKAAKILTEDQYLGIASYDDLRARWLSSIEAPRPHAIISRYGDERVGSPPAFMFDPANHTDRVQRTANRFKDAERVLIRSGHKETVLHCLEADEMVGPYDVAPGAVEGLRAAGDALALHFGHKRG